MSSIKISSVLFCFFIMVLSGCGGSGVKEVDEICLPNLSRAQAFEVSEKVLNDMDFTVAKLDEQAGVIISRPLAGGQFFEFWRKDDVGAFNTAEANLHTIRRTVELNISEPVGQLCVGCSVKAERLSITNIGGDYMGGLEYDRLNGRRMRTAALEMDIESAEKSWIELGEDKQLAAAILNRIQKAAAKN